jgi:hypothetical protein
MAIKITQNGIDTIQDNIINSDKIQDNSISPDDLPSGSVVNYARTHYTGRTSFTSTSSDTDVPGMSVEITAKSDNSKFLVVVRHFLEVDNAWNICCNIHKDGVRVNQTTTSNIYGLAMPSQSYSPAANNNDSTPESLDFTTLDTTGSNKGQTYTFKLVVCSPNNKTYFVNRVFNNSQGNKNYEIGTSEIIVYEIKG